MQIPANITPLKGCVSFETAHAVFNYPYGRLVCEMRFWVETREKFGQRLVMCSKNPKNGRWNTPNAGNYSRMVCLYVNNDNGHCEQCALSFWHSKAELDEFERVFGATFDDWQKKELHFLHVANKRQNAQSYFGFTDKQLEIYKGLVKIANETLRSSGYESGKGVPLPESYKTQVAQAVEIAKQS